MMNDAGRYFAFHVYNPDDGSYINEETDSNRMALLKLRDEYKALGFKIVGDPQRGDDLFELSNGPLFNTPMDYNELTVLK
jgi:hypothetical protein